MINLDNALNLVQTIAHNNKEHFTMSPSFLDHCKLTSMIAGNIAHSLGLDSNELCIAGCLHDIGRCFTKDQEWHTFHEIIGADYIERNGEELYIGTETECYRIAQTIRSHGVVYEQYTMKEYDIYKNGLNVDKRDLLPSSWNELVIVYADLTNTNGKIVPFKQRLDDLKKNDKKKNNPRLHALKKAQKRLLTIKKDMEQALISETTNNKYGVLQ